MKLSKENIARMWFFHSQCTSKARLVGKTVIITGANTGIGKETARDLYRRGIFTVILYNLLNNFLNNLLNWRKRGRRERERVYVRISLYVTFI